MRRRASEKVGELESRSGREEKRKRREFGRNGSGREWKNRERLIIATSSVFRTDN